MPRRAARAQPGIRFVSQPPPLDEVLPRMDIAVFVGFASRGPIDTPVPLEDAGDFAAIFGPDAPLAWDAERGETTHAYLAPAVRAFFRNGGTRCWVVRVARAGSSNLFPIPGLARLAGDALAPAFARASSPGRWSDGLRVGSAVSVRPIEIVATRARGDLLDVDFQIAWGSALVTGDLIRLRGAGHVAFLAVDTVTAGPPSSPPSDRPGQTASGRPIWFRTTSAANGVPANLVAVVYTARREPAGPLETFAQTAPVIAFRIDGADGIVELDLRLDVADAPAPGALVSVDAGAEELWITVHDAGVGAPGAATATDSVVVRGAALWRLPAAPADPGPMRGECLRLDLWVRETDVRTLRLGDLGLAPAHPRYWAALPTDDERFDPDGDVTRSREARALDAGAGFPLAGAGPGGAVYLPLDVTLDADRLLGAARQPRTALARDGLAVFDVALFLDPVLAGSSTDSLMDAADHLRYGTTTTRRPRGVHAALDIEEATLIAAPDATHRGWRRAPEPPLVPPQASEPFARPEWWRHLPCDPPSPLPRATAPPMGQFLACGTRVIPPPHHLRRLDEDSSGTYTLAWEVDEPAESVLEEARAADFSDAVAIVAGPDTRLTIYGRSDGTYYYRVRARVGAQTSDWSEGLAVRVTGAAGWRVSPVADFDGQTLLDVQRALLRVAAARGDMFAVLALPAHMREDDAIAHARALKAPAGMARRIETRTLSFGALYHPWLVAIDADRRGVVQILPPDGTLTGLLAGRARSRGAWIAAANEPLKGVVALSPALSRSRRADSVGAGVNLISQEPRGFLTLSADTLTDDYDLVPIGVRRLLSLLRRLALREGVTYVFEPHNDSFRRLVQRGFESFLSRMFERGAFAGATADSAYRVVTGSELNTAQSVDQGRFIVELRVAPALPLSFLTVRLVQSGDRTLLVEER